MTTTLYDLSIIGGGINGVGIARDAALRGLSVFLCEQNDLASHTSSKSSKLIHGGLRYLEYGEFKLVRKALAEREVLLGIAPHLVAPLSLMIPHNQLQRPAWLIRLGLFFYDHLGWRWGKKSMLPRSFAVNSRQHPLYFDPLTTSLQKGFIYADCTVDDARLVILNAKSAEEQGANICTHTRLISAARKEHVWDLTLQNTVTNQITKIQSRVLINAGGPWVDEILTERLHLTSTHHIELVKGSHILVPKLYEGRHAYLLQNSDKRVVFVIPYQENLTLIGTTDVLYQGDPAQVTIDEAEKNYLCEVVNRYFERKIHARDIVHSWSGVRPLQKDLRNNPAAVTRDYHIELNQEGAPLINLFGGKITTYRELAVEVLDKLKVFFKDLPVTQTAMHALPGGDFEKGDLAAFKKRLATEYPNLPENLRHRYAHQYGTRCYRFLSGKTDLASLGENFGADLYEAEVRYLVQEEWAQDAEAILWRRTKLGLVFSKEEVERLACFLKGI